MIDAPVFAMEIAHENESSWIEIGGYDSRGTIYWVDMVGEHYHWTVPMPKVTLDGEEVSMRAKEATLDSGTSLTYVPEKDYDAILENIKRETECYEYESYPGFIFCSCKSAYDDKFPKIGIQLGPEYIFEFPSSSYITYVSHFLTDVVRFSI